jgi:FeS assembly SUF system protein
MTATSKEDLEEQIIDALREIYDPEIPVNIHELGLIYKIDIDQNGAVAVQMTFMHPGCPMAASLPKEVEQKVKKVPGVTSAKIEIVLDPPWNPDMISDAGKLQLGML